MFDLTIEIQINTWYNIVNMTKNDKKGGSKNEFRI